jgi:hypothetical protein
MQQFKYTLGLLAAGFLTGQVMSGQEFSRFSFDVGGGFTQPVGNTGRHLDEGWNVRGGAGINFSQYLGAMVQLDYNRFGINGTTLNAAGFPGGDVSVFSATLDPIVHLTPRGHFDVYLSVVVGYIAALRSLRSPAWPPSLDLIRSSDFIRRLFPRPKSCRLTPSISQASTVARVSRSEPSGTGSFSPRLAITGFL